ncbi:hypothetical protein T4A_5481 [Trichinella pseudospiralis]|uniref:Uncharacterized protein n=2 Tax=Trichinella pseudospiralis TaxID=6337 RepID=A0A0V1DN81_TRIPS|nr:hypothetical protein T4A_5481 [Trichinella pseudospiralis]
MDYLVITLQSFPGISRMWKEMSELNSLTDENEILISGETVKHSSSCLSHCKNTKCGIGGYLRQLRKNKGSHKSHKI